MTTKVEDTLAYLIRQFEETHVPKGDQEIVQMTYRMPEELRFRLDVVSDWLGMTRTGLMNELLESALTDAIEKIQGMEWTLDGMKIKEMLKARRDPMYGMEKVA